MIVHKRNRNCRHKPASGDMRPLLLNLVHDLAQDLENPDRLVALIAREDPSGKVVRAYVSNLVSDAESSLHSLTVRQYAALRQLEAFLKKNTTGAVTASVRKDAALQKFWSAEKQCRIVNKRLRYFSRKPSRMRPLIQEVFATARQEIFSLIGSFDGGDLEACLENCDFGPGLTFGAQGRDSSHLYYKVGGETITGTGNVRDQLPMLREVFPAWFSVLVEQNVMFQEVPGNRITVVPKTAEIDRVIAIEPALNVFLQKGAEKVLSRYLQKWGVTLQDQTRNHLPARIGSVNGEFSTIDLSSASDSVSLELVRWLLPPGWFNYLDGLRSKKFTVDRKEWHEYAKFSSMGNATTFPLECLVFCALLRATCRVTGTPMVGARVYGDDIIAPRNVALLLIEALAFGGFSVNGSKTFIFGPFRESCGVDYLNGIDVRPVYLKRFPKTEDEVYNLFNRLRVNRFGFRLERTMNYLWDLVPRKCFSPPDMGAGAEWHKWYLGSANTVDQGFHVPSYVVRRFARHSRTLHSLSYRVPVRARRFKTSTREYCEVLRYQCFLLGVEAGEVQLKSESVTYTRHAVYSVWRDVGWFPSFLILRFPKLL